MRTSGQEPTVKRYSVVETIRRTPSEAIRLPSQQAQGTHDKKKSPRRGIRTSRPSEMRTPCSGRGLSIGGTRGRADPPERVASRQLLNRKGITTYDSCELPFYDYGVSEQTEMVHQAGFAITAMHNRYDPDEPYDKSRPGLIIVASPDADGAGDA